MLRYAPIVLLVACAVLTAIGLAMLTSTGAWVPGMSDPHHFVIRQAGYIVVGIVLAVVAAMRDWEPLMRKTWVWALVVISILLLLCFIPPIGVEIYGSKRWVKAPGIGTFQPSEVARIVVMMAAAAWYARWQVEVRTFLKGFLFPLMILGIPILLILGETDLGVALTLSLGIAGLMYCAGVRLLYLFPIAGLAVGGAYFYVSHNANRWTRIEAWLDLEKYQLGKGMQQWRALLAFGNGGPTGVGLGNGAEKFGTLTFSHIDFIFPEIGEEFGLVGTLLVVFCFCLIAVSGISIAMQARTMFQRLFALGLTYSIVISALENMGVTTALLPNDGLPLPFISYGGTSLVVTFVSIGCLVGIHRFSYREIIPEKEVTRLGGREVRL